MLTMPEEDEGLFEAIKSGASGYLLKSLDAGKFFELPSGLERGEVALSPSLAAKILEEFAHQTGGTEASLQAGEEGPLAPAQPGSGWER